MRGWANGNGNEWLGVIISELGGTIKHYVTKRHSCEPGETLQPFSV
jgi:hypothetical protein